MIQQYLHVELDADYTLDFKIHNTPLAELWLERMRLRGQYPLDHPDRFYSFNSKEQEVARAEAMIRDCIATINSYEHIVEREFTNVDDQDCLNYLHNIFERYHGLLQQQKTYWWFKAPDSVKKALAELNLAVHRCETASQTPRPRFVCTWFGLPKTEVLPEDLMQKYGILNPPFGSVCLNYVEIGKTLHDLTIDNDIYIGEDAFQPFTHYNPDFVARFFETPQERINEVIEMMRQYHRTNYEFFSSRGLNNFEHVKLLPLYFPVAQLIETVSREELLRDIQQRQYITKVYIDETSNHCN